MYWQICYFMYLYFYQRKIVDAHLNSTMRIITGCIISTPVLHWLSYPHFLPTSIFRLYIDGMHSSENTKRSKGTPWFLVISDFSRFRLKSRNASPVSENLELTHNWIEISPKIPTELLTSPNAIRVRLTVIQMQRINERRRHPTQWGKEPSAHWLWSSTTNNIMKDCDSTWKSKFSLNVWVK